MYHTKLTHKQVFDQDLNLTFESKAAVFLLLCQAAILWQAAIRAHNALCTAHDQDDTLTCTERVMQYGRETRGCATWALTACIDLPGGQHGQTGHMLSCSIQRHVAGKKHAACQNKLGRQDSQGAIRLQQGCAAAMLNAPRHVGALLVMKHCHPCCS